MRENVKIDLSQTKKKFWQLFTVNSFCALQYQKHWYHYQIVHLELKIPILIVIFAFSQYFENAKDFTLCKNSTSLMHLIFCCWKDWQLQTQALRNVLLRKLSSKKTEGKREQLLMTLLFTKRKLLYKKSCYRNPFYLVVK